MTKYLDEQKYTYKFSTFLCPVLFSNLMNARNNNVTQKYFYIFAKLSRLYCVSVIYETQINVF